MAVLYGQRLKGGEEGHGDVAVAVGERRLREFSVAEALVDALVVDPDPVLGGEVVVDGHLPAADQSQPADLARVEPADVDVGRQAQVFEVEPQVRDILNASVRVP